MRSRAQVARTGGGSWDGGASMHGWLAVPAAVALGSAPAAAMIEYGPLARTAAVEAGCLAPELQRLGNEGADVVYAMTCAAGSPVPSGRIRCGVQTCTVEPPPVPADES